ncbi:MAG: gliding motility-associated C-terminal domain-containing protein [Bacteroidota bacterium]
MVSENEKISHYSVRIVGRKEFCVYEKKDVIPIYSIKVPNVITPNQSPGKNDTFKILLNDQPISIGGVKTSLVIFNRWGEKIFAKDNYKDNWSGESLALAFIIMRLRLIRKI